MVALARAAELLAEHGGGAVVGGVVDLDTRGPAAGRSRSTPAAPGPGRRACRLPGRAGRRAARRAVGCDGRRRRARCCSVTPPSWRPDLTDPADLVEEVVRLAGYDDIPSVLPTAPPGRGLTDGAAPPAQRSAGRWPRPATSRRRPTRSSGRRRSTRSACPADDPRRDGRRRAQPAVGGGAGAADDAAARPARRRCARNLAPRPARPRRCSSTARCSPAGGADAGAAARRRPASGRRDARRAADAAVPEQPWHVAVALAGDREPRGWWGPGRPAELGRRGRRPPGWSPRPPGVELTVRAGRAGAVAPGPLRRAAGRRPGGRARRRAAPAGVRGAGAAARAPAPWSWTSTRCRRPPVPVGPPISTFPPVLIDLALVVPDERAGGRGRGGAARRGRASCWSTLRLFDVYTGAQVGDGPRSLAYALTLRAPDRTLTGEEATRPRDAAVERRPWRRGDAA